MLWDFLFFTLCITDGGVGGGASPMNHTDFVFVQIQKCHPLNKALILPTGDIALSHKLDPPRYT